MGNKRQREHGLLKIVETTLLNNIVMVSDVAKTITYKTKPKTKAKTFDVFQDQNHKNGMRISSLSLIAVFL